MLNEKRIRNKAREVGYSIHKGFVHCTSAQGCPVWHRVDGSRDIGYDVVDEATGYQVWGSYNQYFDHQWSLEQVEDFIRSVYEDHGLVF